MKSSTGRAWPWTHHPEANIHLHLSSAALSHGQRIHRAPFSKRLTVWGNEHRLEDNHTALTNLRQTETKSYWLDLNVWDFYTYTVPNMDLEIYKHKKYKMRNEVEIWFLLRWLWCADHGFRDTYFLNSNTEIRLLLLETEWKQSQLYVLLQRRVTIGCCQLFYYWSHKSDFLCLLESEKSLKICQM